MAGQNFETYSSEMLSLVHPRVILKNPNVQNLCELGKIWKNSLRSTFKNPSLKSMNDLEKFTS